MSYWKLIPEMWSHKNSAYGYVNETAVRIWANSMFTIWFFTLLSVYYDANYELALVVIAFFRLDFLLKVIDPRYSYFNQLANFLSHHKPVVRVWAIQKRFARKIGLIISSMVLFFLTQHIIQGHTPQTHGFWVAPSFLCIICLIFMRLEWVLGRCAGCKIFEFLVKHKFLTNRDHQNCPDDGCGIEN